MTVSFTKKKKNQNIYQYIATLTGRPSQKKRIEYEGLVIFE